MCGDLAQLARAPALHAGGQGFDSLSLHHRKNYPRGLRVGDFFARWGVASSREKAKKVI